MNGGLAFGGTEVQNNATMANEVRRLRQIGYFFEKMGLSNARLSSYHIDFSRLARAAPVQSRCEDRQFALAPDKPLPLPAGTELKIRETPDLDRLL